ncbi:hypothetical protein BpHYR1_041954 [Brachionus plicatilis]|uniref:Uncharacterized protein n=1 Tax=Brachionus plicatilis TaxID=10195 RepID=A0A3M7PSN7_BRAPC|nr:hypothetical protein BpHYR1_041954 [Brachionus plicatilis]
MRLLNQKCDHKGKPYIGLLYFSLQPHLENAISSWCPCQTSEQYGDCESQKRFKLQLKHQILSQKIFGVWNKLEEKIVSAISLNRFKTKIDVLKANHTELPVIAHKSFDCINYIFEAMKPQFEKILNNAFKIVGRLLLVIYDFGVVKENLVLKIGLQNTLQFSAFCTPLKSILINCAHTYILVIGPVAIFLDYNFNYLI